MTNSALGVLTLPLTAFRCHRRYYPKALTKAVPPEFEDSLPHAASVERIKPKLREAA
jgi:hypothetical protein